MFIFYSTLTHPCAKSKPFPIKTILFIVYCGYYFICYTITLNYVLNGVILLYTY